MEYSKHVDQNNFSNKEKDDLTNKKEDKASSEEIQEIREIYETITTIFKAVVNNRKDDFITSKVEKSKQVSSFELKIHSPEIFNNNLKLYRTLKEEYNTFANHYFNTFQENKKILYKSYDLFTKLLEKHIQYIESNYKKESFKLGLIILIDLFVATETKQSLEKLYDDIKIAFCALDGVNQIELYKVSDLFDKLG